MFATYQALTIHPIIPRIIPILCTYSLDYPVTYPQVIHINPRPVTRSVSKIFAPALTLDGVGVG